MGKETEIKVKEIIINPELPIGTEFWVMKNSKVILGLVAAYKVYVTSCTDKGSWHEQLFNRWLNKTQKEIWKYFFNYEVKLHNEIIMHSIEKKKDGNWYLLDKKIYFSKEELLKAL